MPESDLIWLSLLVFLPAAFAVGLLLVPGEVDGGDALVGAVRHRRHALRQPVRRRRLLQPARQPPRRQRLARGTRSRRGSTPAPTRPPATRPSRSRRYCSPTTGSPAGPWIARFDIQYALGVDGISLPLVVLTALVMFLAIVASWKIEKSVRGYLVLLLLLETGVIGAFLALDFFLFYVFYELMLLPMYVLIGLWGGGRRRYAALKFVIYTLLGSVGLLVAMIGLYIGERPRLRRSGGRDDRGRASCEGEPGVTPPSRHATTRRGSHASTSSRSRRPAGRSCSSSTARKTGSRAKTKLERRARRRATTADKVQLFAPGVEPRRGHRAPEGAAGLHEDSSST